MTMDVRSMGEASLSSYLGFMQSWEMNGALHGTLYFTALNGPTWLAMHDTSKYPSDQR